MVDGPGYGTFDNPSLQNVQFFGQTRDHCTVQVTASSSSMTCKATTDVVVIEITDLSEDVPLQMMDQYLLEGTSGASYVIPFIGSYGELRSVKVAPPYDPDAPFQWNVDFEGLVDHSTGNVTLNFYRDGPYCIKKVEDAGGGQLVETLFQVAYNAPAATEKIATATGKAYKIPAPTGNLVMVDNSPNDNGYLVNVRAFFGANRVDIGSVADVNTAIGNKLTNGGGAAFTALLCSHGAVAKISMGDGDITIAGKYIDDQAATQADRTAFYAACVPAVTTFTFAHCDVASGAQGANFLQAVATGGKMTAIAPNCHIYCTKDKKWYLDVGGNWVTKNK